MEIEVADHTQLERGIHFPGWLSLGDGDHVDEMKHNLHCQKRYQEADAVIRGSASVYAGGFVLRLRNVVIER